MRGNVTCRHRKSWILRAAVRDFVSNVYHFEEGPQVAPNYFRNSLLNDENPCHSDMRSMSLHVTVTRDSCRLYVRMQTLLLFSHLCSVSPPRSLYSSRTDRFPKGKTSFRSAYLGARSRIARSKTVFLLEVGMGKEHAALADEARGCVMLQLRRARRNHILHFKALLVLYYDSD